MKYENKRNGKIATLVQESTKFKTVDLSYEDGTTTTVTISTLKRWWKALPEEETEYVQEVMQQKEDLGIEVPEIDPEQVEIVEQDQENEVCGDGTSYTEVMQEIVAGAKEKAKKVRKPKTTIKVEADYIKPSLDYIYNLVTSNGDTIFAPESGTKMRTFKVDGKMYAKLDYSKTSIALAVKSAALEAGVRTPDKVMNHMFDAKYVFTGNLTDEDKDLISTLLSSARQFRVDKTNNTRNKKKGDK